MSNWDLIWLTPCVTFLATVCFKKSGKDLVLSIFILFFLLLTASPFGWNIAQLIAKLFQTELPSKFDLFEQPSRGFAILLTTTIVGIATGLGLAQLFSATFNLFRGSHQPTSSIDKELDLTVLKKELDAHRQFYKSIYHYHGSYPVWKVQQEFREIIESLKPDSEQCLWHFHNLDTYLSKLVDGVDSLRDYYDPEYSSGHGWGDQLKFAKGDHLLDSIQLKHPNLQKFQHNLNLKTSTHG